MTDRALSTDLRKFCAGLYVVYALGALLVPTALLVLGGILILVALVAGHGKKEMAKGSLYESHLRWMSRTFWIANIYYLITSIIATAYMYYFTNIPAEMNALLDMPSSMAPNALGAITAHMEKIEAMTTIPYLITSLPPSVWWIHRCWQGFTQLKKDKPVANVTTWL
jgi:uncharacterized membrane protein